MVKRIIALVGIFALIGLYVATLILAVVGNDQSFTMMKVAFFSTIILPVLLWVYSFIYKLLKNNFNVYEDDKKKEASDTQEDKESK